MYSNPSFYSLDEKNEAKKINSKLIQIFESELSKTSRFLFARTCARRMCQRLLSEFGQNTPPPTSFRLSPPQREARYFVLEAF
jgi:hypothetical protein